MAGTSLRVAQALPTAPSLTHACYCIRKPGSQGSSKRKMLPVALMI